MQPAVEVIVLPGRAVPSAAIGFDPPALSERMERGSESLPLGECFSRNPIVGVAAA